MNSEPEKPATEHLELDRRGFLAYAGRGAATFSLLSALGLSGCLNRDRMATVKPTPLTSPPQVLTADEWQTLAAVQDHILPSDPESPGAKEINATGYLDAALTGSDIDPAETKQVKAGVVMLEQLSHELAGNAFSALSEAERETVMRKLETEEDGENWLRLVIVYTLEALLGDPVYGGNTDGAGWKWLGHVPGFPRPPQLVAGSRR